MKKIFSHCLFILVAAFLTLSRAVPAGAAAPSADFSGTPTTWNAPATVNFTDRSSVDVTGWLWDFGDGTQSNQKNPAHQYDRAGAYAVTLTVTAPGGTNTLVKTGYITVEEYVPVVEEYLINIDAAAHLRFGLFYPVTYKFRLPSGAQNLAAQYRYWEGTWRTLPEKTSTDLFNGIDAVRFDYIGGFAYVSVRFDRSSDNIYLRVIDASGKPLPLVFDSIPKFYDERQAAVTITLDDWALFSDADFKVAIGYLTADNLYHSAALMTNDVPWSSVQQVINQAGDLIEMASHTVHHPCSTSGYQSYGYQAEVVGSRDAIRNNLVFSANPYVPAFIEPCGFTDDTLPGWITAGDYLVSRSASNYVPYGSNFVAWDATQGRYGRAALVLATSSYAATDSKLLTDANAVFNSVLTSGLIYHLLDHPREHHWFDNSPLVQHLDYVKGRTNVWYVPFGQLYLYHFIQEQRGNLSINHVVGAAVTSKPVTVTVGDAALPSPWTTRDVGRVPLAGSSSYRNGIFTLKGAGSDIWGTADSFRYALKPLVGDGQIIARVASLQHTNGYAKAGVMIRETLSADSVHAMVNLTPANGAEFSRRVTTGASISVNSTANVAAPYWVKLVRSGNTFTGYVSKDGVSWTQVGNSTVAMATSAYVGLVVTSHSTSKLCSATFDGVSVTGSPVVAPTVTLAERCPFISCLDRH